MTKKGHQYIINIWHTTSDSTGVAPIIRTDSPTIFLDEIERLNKKYHFDKGYPCRTVVYDDLTIFSFKGYECTESYYLMEENNIVRKPKYIKHGMITINELIREVKR